MIITSEKTTLHAPTHGWDYGHAGPYMDRRERVDAILSEVRSRGYDDLVREARTHGLGPIRAVHTVELIDHLRACRTLDEDQGVYPYVFPYHPEFSTARTDLKQAGYYSFDVGTVVRKDTFVSAVASVDTAVTGAEELLDERAQQVFAISRPPGHHADRAVYGGLCFFNNAAAAARVLSDYDRVAILDLDFHHGNGTQGIFYHDPHVLYVSIHGDPERHFPFFCGHPDETGADLGEGANLNIPLAPGTDFEQYHAHLNRAFSRIGRFAPRFLVVSIGFDTFVKDPLGDFRLPADSFRSLGREIRQTGYRVLACLEGGYDIDDLGSTAADFIEGLLDLS